MRLLALTIVVLLMSCGNDEINPELVYGTWATDNATMTFTKFGSIETKDSNGSVYKFNYSMKSNVLCTTLTETPAPQFTPVGYSECVDIIKLTETTLSTKDDNNEVVTYKKQSM